MHGLVAFVPAVSMTAAMAFGGCAIASYRGLPASHQWLDRNEDSMHPGEGGA
jgi:hypothetical protein